MNLRYPIGSMPADCGNEAFEFTYGHYEEARLT